MSSTRTAPRTTSNSKTTFVNSHPANGSSNSYEMNDSAANLNYSAGNNTEFESNPQRSSLKRNVSQYEGIYRNARFIHAISSGLLGQQVIIQTNDHERFHGVLETFSPNADIVLTVSHRLDKNNNDLLSALTQPIDLIDTIDSSAQTFELHKRIIKVSNIVEIIAVDVDLSANAKCSLDENPKVSQLEDDRFNRMEHFYGSDEIDPDTLGDLEIGDDGKAGFDPEDMFHTNREKFNTTTDFDESKYTNVPVRQLSSTEVAEIEKKAKEIEQGSRSEDIDEDDAGVKRPSESLNPDDRNSNLKANRSNRNDFRYDAEYNPSKRENWRDQRGIGANNNRRGGGNNLKQSQYAPSNARQQYNTRIPRSHRYTNNPSPHQMRDSSSTTTMTANEESTHSQRTNSSNFSQEQSAESTTGIARAVYSSANRSSLANQHSPAMHTDSSSSRTNSISATSPPPSQQTTMNKTTKKSSFSEQQQQQQELINDENEQLKQQRSSNNQTHTVSGHRPSHMQSKQPAPLANTNTNVVSPPTHSSQDDSSSSHDLTHTNQSHTTGTTTPNSIKSNAGLNPEADEFVPVFSRESTSRPDSRDASTTSSASVATFLSSGHPQPLHILPQQSVQPQSTTPMIPVTPAQNQAALFHQYYQAALANMPQFINATPQQMTVGVMSAPMIPSQPLITAGSNTNNSSNGSSSGMTTPNSSVSAGPTYKINNNNNNNHAQVNSSDNGASGVTNVPLKKAVVSVQRTEQSNGAQQPVPSAVPMVYPGASIRYYSPDYLTQQAAASQMHLPQFPYYYAMNASSLIQAASAVGQPPNVMIPPTTVSTGSATPGMPPIHYASVYADPRMYSMYSPAAAAAANSAGVHPNWQLARSPPQQQQQSQLSADPQRPHGTGQSVAAQQNSATGSSTTSGRSTSTSSQSGASQNSSGPSFTPQYMLNGAVPAAYAYGGPAAWISGAQQVQAIPTNISPQLNAGYNIVFDPSQPVPPQQATYLHRGLYDTTAYFPSISQQQPPPPSSQPQQQPPQPGIDSVPQGNYNR